MSDLLNVGVSALLAYRSALDTAGHNIANANTVGYSRQRVELQARLPTQTGNGYVGNGVASNTTVRLSDALITARALGDTSSYSRLDAFQQLASRVDTLMSNADTGLAQPLQNFFSAMDGVAANPSSTAARQAWISAAGSLGSSFQDLQAQLDGMESDINSQLSSAVSDVNQYAASIAAINDRIAVARGMAGGQPPNDLMDQRDQMISELSQRIGVSTVAQNDGSINVFTAGGQALVLGSRANALSLTDDAFHSGRQELVLGGSNINNQISGGSIGGLLDARTQLLDPAANRLGRIAAGMTESINAQNAQGMDQRGQLGANLFVPLSGSALPALNNAGSASVDVGFDDASQLSSENYQLRYTGAAWQLTQASTGAAVPMSGSGTTGDPFVAAGLSFVVSGGAASGDRFLIQPTRNAASNVQLATTDPSRIAAAAPINTTASISNAGSGSISAGSIVDATQASLLSPVNIAFTSSSTYSINGSGSYAYTPGSNIDLNGWRVQISGTPAVGDQFQIQPNGANSGNNRNALQLSAFSSQGVLDGGRSSLTVANASLVSQTGGIAQQATLRRDAQAAIQQQTQNERDAVSGVNLDEEAADLVRYQQAYQAAARIIAVADEVFRSLLDAARS